MGQGFGLVSLGFAFWILQWNVMKRNGLSVGFNRSQSQRWPLLWSFKQQLCFNLLTVWFEELLITVSGWDHQNRKKSFVVAKLDCKGAPFLSVSLSLCLSLTFSLVRVQMWAAGRVDTLPSLSACSQCWFQSSVRGFLWRRTMWWFSAPGQLSEPNFFRAELLRVYVVYLHRSRW